MPNIIESNSSSYSGYDPSNAPADGYEYGYPDDLDLSPESPLHDFIKSFVLSRARASSDVMKRNFPQWRKTDEKMTAYIPVDDKEVELKEKDVRKPTSVVFPYSFVIAESILSYLIAAFFPEPIFRFEGKSPEDIVGSIMMENVIQSHCNRNKVALNLHTMFYDAIKYGIGIAVPIWTVKHGFKVVKQSSGIFNIFSKFLPTKDTRTLEESIIYEGNALQNIDPYNYLPDPNVAVQEVQAGEFSGYIENTNLYSLLSREKDDPSKYFNAKYVRHVRHGRTSIYVSDSSNRMIKQGGSERNTSELSPVDIIWINATIIPSKFGKEGNYIGDSEYPEKWSFGLAGDSIVISAKPLGLTHNDYPISVIAPDFDGYSPIANSRLAIEYGLQEILDYLLNSHVANLRKAVNDMIIVDPYQVNINDLKNPKEGAIIRLRRPAWGRGVKDVAQQLVINDITRNNIGDASFIMQMMDNVGSAGGAMQGNLRQGGPERLTKGEFQGTLSGAVNRIERIARIIGMMGMQDIGYFFAHHTQQMLSMDTYIKTTGRWQETIMREYSDQVQNNRMLVTPFDLLVDYDLLIRDGSVPGGNYSESWIQLYQILAQNPELTQSFEMVRIFKHIARGLGAKDVDQFERLNPPTASTMPDETIESEVQKGNLVPVGGANGK
jgi:hypothetical protein